MHQAWRQTRSFRASQRARTRASFKRTHSWSITRCPSPSRVSSAQRRTSPSIRSMGPTGEVGARPRLRVADREVTLAGEDAGEEEGLLLRCAVLHDRRTDRVEGEEGEGEAGALDLVGEDELLDRRATLPPVLLRPANAQPPVPAHLAERVAVERPAALLPGELGLELRRQELREVGAQLLPELPLLGRVVEIHRRAKLHETSRGRQERSAGFGGAFRA